MEFNSKLQATRRVLCFARHQFDVHLAHAPKLLTKLFTAQRLARQKTNLCHAQVSQRCVLSCRAVTCAKHFASRQAPPLPHRLRAEPKINGLLSDARLDKPRFALKAQVLQKALPLPLPWLAHLCSLHNFFLANSACFQGNLHPSASIGATGTHT